MENTNDKAKIAKIKQDMITAFDENGNGQIDLEDVIIKCLRIPGVKIERESFLRNEFGHKISKDIIEKAICSSPMEAGIKQEFIDKCADNVIKYQRFSASGISSALAIPGGLAALATIPVDIAQYYGNLLIVMQKLMYLYGFKQLDFEHKGSLLDSETMSVVVTCFGIMFGLATANKVLMKLIPSFAAGASKKFMATAVTKSLWYPALKKILSWFNIKLTKQMFTKALTNSAPVIGMVIGGTITYFSFAPCCTRLKNQLSNTILSNPNFVEPLETDKAIEEINVDSNIDENEIDKMIAEQLNSNDNDVSIEETTSENKKESLLNKTKVKLGDSWTSVKKKTVDIKNKFKK